MNNNSIITVTGAREHNLKNITLSFPRNKLIVVSGVSGSGKSTLVYDVLFREAERRYLGSFSSYARQFIGRMHQPEVDSIEGLSPAIALDQKSVVGNPRSTVGTMTGIYDLLRLLYARCGEADTSLKTMKLSRSLFSFNSSGGACPVCKGLGVEDFLDPDLLVADPEKSLRQSALVITAPNGYIIYSQVTLDVLDQVCRAEGFHIDIPWRDLTDAQKSIIYYGSNKIEIPFGKHPLESRMKWTGITAKPREMGFYKGILPIMEEILRRDRNKNILRFVRSVPCHSCQGRRLNPEALAIKIAGKNIAEVADIPLNRLANWLQNAGESVKNPTAARSIVEEIAKQVSFLGSLGLGYLHCARASSSLSGGESQRIRMASWAGMEMSDMIFILDEPSVGLHPHDTSGLIGLLCSLRDRGNTVLVVEHDEEFIRRADWLIDIGPGPGDQGGKVLYNGPVREILSCDPNARAGSRTIRYLMGEEKIVYPAQRRQSVERIEIKGITTNNLKSVDTTFHLHSLNVVTGVSGAGKSSLVKQTLIPFLEQHIQGLRAVPSTFREISGYQQVKKLILIDQSPIGRTPRSNPATYTGLFDHIRDLYASQPLALELGFDKGRFSFNTPGGRCEGCEGAGYQQVGMHFMGNVEVPCDQCQGKRFDAETLSVTWNGLSISEVLEMSISAAIPFFQAEQKIVRYLTILDQLGLGYLKLGQRSSTLSGGEAQRVKLASELAKPVTAHTLYFMDEPTTGLHSADVEKLVKAFENLIGQGHTIVVIEHHPSVIFSADHVIDLGPGSGEDGGEIVAEGTPETLINCHRSVTGSFLQAALNYQEDKKASFHDQSMLSVPGADDIRNSSEIKIIKATTNNLKEISVVIPKRKMTVITGVSGSGKSSLAFDTLHAEAQRRFLDSFSPWLRSRIGMPEQAGVEEIRGLTPTLALEQGTRRVNPRSTVGTVTGIYDLFRLLYSRLQMPSIFSTLFSFNHKAGACPHCDGIGEITRCDVSRLVTHPEKSLLSGAMDGTRTGRFYGDVHGQYMAMLKRVGEVYHIDYHIPWNDLAEESRQIAMDGAGAQTFEVVWEYKRGERSGSHHYSGKWPGLATLVVEEYARKHADHRGESMMNVMMNTTCDLCGGKRLNREALSYTVAGLNIAELCALPVSSGIRFFRNLKHFYPSGTENEVAEQIGKEILQKLQNLNDLGLSYLTTERKTDSLSSGELRRVKLSSLLGMGMTGVTYVLDEPTAGLHSRDTARLIARLRSLCGEDNTVVLVEHDAEVIRSADIVIDLGPGAGTHGGQLVAAGTPDTLMKNPESLTGRYLSGSIETPLKKSRTLNPGLSIRGACIHNLKGFDVDIPAGGITVVSGVSGSGKSSLVLDVIFASFEAGKAVGCREITGLNHFGRALGAGEVMADVSGTSVVATYIGLMDPLRELFAATEAAHEMAFGKNFFSFLNKEGQCKNCNGSGMVVTSMDFLPDIHTVCESCQGRRYSDEILKISYLGKNIAEILNLTVVDAVTFFKDHRKISDILDLLVEMGLDYLKLGQSTSDLSGGEIQRLHLVSELRKPVKSPSLYLLDEPSTGLHPVDVHRLLILFNRLAYLGHTFIIIEHNPEIIAFADYLITLGPEGGGQGGWVL